MTLSVGCSPYAVLRSFLEKGFERVAYTGCFFAHGTDSRGTDYSNAHASENSVEPTPDSIEESVDTWKWDAPEVLELHSPCADYARLPAGSTPR